jgi:hypothetical protein
MSTTHHSSTVSSPSADYSVVGVHGCLWSPEAAAPFVTISATNAAGLALASGGGSASSSGSGDADVTFKFTLSTPSQSFTKEVG